jgi:hypothetical protein
MTKITKTGDGRFETNHFKYHPRTMWARGNEVVLVPYGFADDVCEYYGGDVQEFMLVREGANDGGGAFYAIIVNRHTTGRQCVWRDVASNAIEARKLATECARDQIENGKAHA